MSGDAAGIMRTAGSASEVGEAVQVIELVESEQRFVLDEEALARVLLHPDVSDRKVAVVSVAGAFRKGKSFLLNFFLRFLQQPVRAGGDDGSWLGDDESELSGFHWCGGSDRQTNGILMWSLPFVARLADGEEIAVLLMDTQGAFDSQSTVKDCATIFALSTMVSSVQIYNLSQNVQEDDLQHLQLFTEYGRLALESNSSKPFQSLMFLVRDWSFPYEAEYGFLGGQRTLEKRLQISDKQHPELQQLRKHIRSCFENITCFLMPHPGLRVATNPQFKGRLHEVEDEFKQQLRSLTPRLLSVANLAVKEVNGAPVTCRELFEYFKAYIKIFQGEDLPEPKSMLLATAEANNLAAVSSAKALYCKMMEEACGGDVPYLAPDDLLAANERAREESLAMFKQARKMGGDEFSVAFLERLDEELYDQFGNYEKSNSAKNLFRSMRTPAVLFAMLVVVYVLQEVFQLLRVDALAQTCSVTLGVILIALGLWAYSRYSGAMRDLSKMIDEFTEWTWTNVMAPLSYESVNQAVQLHRKLSQHPNATQPAPRVKKDN